MCNTRQERQEVRVNYYQIFDTFNMPTSYLIKWVWEREVDINWSMVTFPVRNYLEVPWPIAGGPSAANAIGT